MKTIGLIGGMSWESSVEYYRMINEEVKKALGGLHSAKCILYSVDFDEIERYQIEGQWEQAGIVLGNIAKKLEHAGADFIVICTNTMHKVVQHIEAQISIPVLHIADATASQINQSEIHTVGLLGTRYTMEQDFYKNRLISNNIEVLVPEKQEIEVINRIIFEELCLGKIKQSSKQYFQQVIQNLLERGAQGIVLGCTEIGLLIKPEDSDVPLYDTAKIHATEAVNFSLKGE